MDKLAKDKGLFIGLSCLSIGCLVGSFGYPLQKLEVWKQVESGQFNIPYERTFVLTENDRNYPYGYSKKSAQLVAQIYEDYKLQKVLLLVLAVLCATYALNMGDETVGNAEIDSEVDTIKAQGKKELILERVKHRLAMASKSQRLLFIDEMKALMDEFGTPEGETLEANELNATDKFVNASYLLGEGHSVDTVVTQTWGCQPGTTEHAELKRKFLHWQSEDSEESTEGSVQTAVDEEVFRAVFPESMDNSTWKAVCKALGEGLTRSDIVKDVLGCGDSQTEVGRAYFDYLKKRFLDG
jgi:hypothetical protein